MAQQASSAEQDCQGGITSWEQVKPIYFPLMRSVRDTLQIILEKNEESVGVGVSHIDEIDISGVFKRAVNCAEEKFTMGFKNKFCFHQTHEFLHEGNLIFLKHANITFTFLNLLQHFYHYF